MYAIRDPGTCVTCSKQPHQNIFIVIHSISRAKRVGRGASKTALQPVIPKININKLLLEDLDGLIHEILSQLFVYIECNI